MDVLVTTTGMGRLRRDPGFTTGWRSLPWLTVQAVLAGRYRIDHGASRDILHANSVWFVPAGSRHRHSAEGTGQVEMAWWQGEIRLHGAIDAFAACGTPRLLTSGVKGPVGQALLRLIDGPIGADLGSELFRQGLAAHLAGALARELSPPEVDPATAAFAPVFRFIDMHLHLPMSRGELAARAGLSPSRFHARFVQLTGVSPMAWVRQRRLARAAGLVESGTMGMAQIAEQVGLCDAYHLNKLFRAVYGVPPSTMRRQANARAR